MWLVLAGSAASAAEAVGADTIFTAHASVGFLIGGGVRLTPPGSLDNDGRMRLGVELYGGLLPYAGLGAGPRWVINVAQDAAKNDAFMITPGADLFLAPEVDSDCCFSPYRDTLFAGGSVELGWTHEFLPHLGFDFGFRGGLLVDLTGGATSVDSPGTLLPQFHLFSGLRF